MLLEVGKREKAQVEMKSGAKGFIVLGGKVVESLSAAHSGGGAKREQFVDLTGHRSQTLKGSWILDFLHARLQRDFLCL